MKPVRHERNLVIKTTVYLSIPVTLEEDETERDFVRYYVHKVMNGRIRNLASDYGFDVEDPGFNGIEEIITERVEGWDENPTHYNITKDLGFRSAFDKL